MISPKTPMNHLAEIHIFTQYHKMSLRNKVKYEISTERFMRGIVTDARKKTVVIEFLL